MVAKQENGSNITGPYLFMAVQEHNNYKKQIIHGAIQNHFHTKICITHKKKQQKKPLNTLTLTPFKVHFPPKHNVLLQVLLQ